MNERNDIPVDVIIDLDEDENIMVPQSNEFKVDEDDNNFLNETNINKITKKNPQNNSNHTEHPQNNSNNNEHPEDNSLNNDKLISDKNEKLMFEKLAIN